MTRFKDAVSGAQLYPWQLQQGYTVTAIDTGICPVKLHDFYFVVYVETSYYIPFPVLHA